MRFGIGVTKTVRNFVIFFQGENFSLEVDGELQPAGFFTSRRIEADNEAEASRLAIAQLLAEPMLEGRALPGYSVRVLVAHEMPLSHKNAYKSFSLYSMKD